MNVNQPDQSAAAEGNQEAWIKPEIVSFKPVEAAEGISYTPSDGISNLSV